MNELNHGPGKGDKDRSPGWRKHYDSIDWQRDKNTGWQRHRTITGVFRKVYRNKKPVISGDITDGHNPSA